MPMSWLFIALTSYFLSALVIILDKFILPARIGQASRAAAFIGALIPFFTFIISVLFFGEELNGTEILGAFLLVFGGMLVIFDLPFKTDQEKFWKKFKYALLAGLLLAIAYSVFKFVYAEQS